MSALAGASAIKNGPHDPGAEATPDVHALELAVWDVPSTTVAGEHFTVAVGARCPCGCDLGGRELALFDQNGHTVGTVKLGRAVWPETEALYFAEVEARAPLEAGSHPWEAKMAGWDVELPHAAGSFPLIVRTITAPDCEVTVRAVDRENQAAIKGARVVMHPYRALTDDDGIAKVRVARGQYDILVSGLRYLPACVSVEVTVDMVTIAELDADHPDEDQE